MIDRDFETFADHFLRTMNAVTALQLQRAALALERARETPHTGSDQPGLTDGIDNGNETEIGR